MLGNAGVEEEDWGIDARVAVMRLRYWLMSCLSHVA